VHIARLVVVAMVCCSSPAFAGITIHFSGTVADDESIEKIAEVACAEAQANSWRCQKVIGDEVTRLDGITAKSIAQIEGSSDFGGVKGVVVNMHAMSEPLYLVFGPSRRLNNFVKTQFAGAETHIRAVELLRKVQPFFRSLEVVDEGGYWETGDRTKLEREFAGVEAAMAKIKSQRSDVHGPVKRPDGRILDLMRE